MGRLMAICHVIPVSIWVRSVALSCLPVLQVFLLLLSIHSKMSLNFMIARWSTDTRVAVQWKSRFENQLYGVLTTLS